MLMVTMLLQDTAARGASPFGTLIFPLAILAIFYFILIVPQRRELKRHQQLVAELQKGDQVVTAGGLIGEIVGVRDDSVQLRTGTATVVVEKARVTRKVVVGEPVAEKK